MRSLPLKAQIYLVFVVACGIAIGVLDALLRPIYRASNLWEFVLFTVLTGIAYGNGIRLTRKKANSDAGSMTLGFAIIFAAMLRLGPTGALIAGSVGCLCSCIYPRRQAIHQVCFNTAVAGVSSWCCGIVFWSLTGRGLAVHALSAVPAVAAAVLTYFGINTIAVAAIITLCSGQKLLKLWRDTFLWTAPSYFAGACVGTIAILMFHAGSWQAVLFVSPVAFLIYQSYAIYVSRAEEKQTSIERLANLYLSTIKSLALAIDAKDQYTHQHILRVQRYSVAMAIRMGLKGDELEGLNTGALLHDIGKLGVPEYVLLKPGRLTDEEYEKIKKHPEIGAAILDPVEFPWPVLPVVKSHHEKWDGTGYPEGLKGEDIPLTARILAAADVYDALTSNRSYRHAWPHEKAVAEIVRCSGTHFDPKVVTAFVDVIDGVVAEMAAETQQSEENALTQAIRPNKAEEAARDIQRAASELWALYEVAETLSASIGLQESLDILGRKLEAILPGTTCLFLLQDHERDVLIVRSAVGPNSELFNGANTLSKSSRSMVAANTRCTYRGDFDHDDLMVVGRNSVNYEAMLSSLIVPLVHQGEMLGTINLYHSKEQSFTAHDQQLLEMIALRAAPAIYNGMLFDRTKSNAHTDSLTGLYNVRFLTQYVDDCCQHAAEAGQPLAVLCMDLDSFKPINDNFGHQKGDFVLRDVAHIFKSVLGEAVIARYGGDEFVAVLTGHAPDDAAKIAGRLQEAVERYDPGLVHDRLGALHLGLSIGVACYPADGADCTTLISAADSRMYLDKTERKLRILAGDQSRRFSPKRLPRAA